MRDCPGTLFVFVGDGETPPQGALPIILTPDFGFAHCPWEHDTLAVLRRLPDLTGKRVLDFGTGSGVLAVAAHRMGAASVDVAEYIPSIRAQADRTFAANDLTVGDDDGGHYDVILANVGDAELLQELGERCDLLIGTAATTKVRISGGRGTRPVYKTRAQDVTRKLRTRGRPAEQVDLDEKFALVIG